MIIETKVENFSMIFLKIHYLLQALLTKIIEKKMQKRCKKNSVFTPLLFSAFKFF